VKHAGTRNHDDQKDQSNPGIEHSRDSRVHPRLTSSADNGEDYAEEIELGTLASYEEK
jgi:hypothetical protein